MEFRELLNSKAELVNQALGAYMEHEQNPQAKIYEAMRYSLLAGGKRLRPAILLMANEICGGDQEQALPFACAVEMIHTYSLIHDDLPAMDDDDLRRGKRTNHKVFGEGIAILAGDALLTKAFEIIAVWDEMGLPPERRIRAISILANLAGTEGMIGGQVVDLEHEGAGMDVETLEYLHGLKTSALIRAAGIVGAVLAGAEEKELQAIDAYCYHLGMAFQIQDDILDVTGSFEELGKPIGSDAENHKTTFVSIYGVERAGELVSEYTKKAVDALAVFTGRAQVLVDLAHDLIGRSA